MEYSQNIYSEIAKSAIVKKVIAIIDNNRTHSARKEALNSMGLEIEDEVRCGTGGVGSIRIRKGIVYIQITCGHSRHNYADCVRVGQIRAGNGISKDYFLSV